jgi:hypothetical protein
MAITYTACLFDAGWSSPVARQAHNLKVIGSNPIPAPKEKPGMFAGLFLWNEVRRLFPQGSPNWHKAEMNFR